MQASQAAATLGRIKTEKKAAAARENGKKGGRPTKVEKPLFIPLKTEWFRAFESGSKTEEFRPLGPRWNPEQCRIGRKAVLAKGYGRYERINGTVMGFRVEKDPSKIPGWKDCYGDKKCEVACIYIKIE